MLERTHDAEWVNRVANDPAVRPFIGAPEMGELDYSAAVERPEHWFLMGEHGGFILQWSAPRVREVHTMILKDGRGAWGASARKFGVDYARKNGTRMLWTKVPPEAPHVERFARQGGMKPTSDVIDVFGVPYRVFSMELR